MILFNTQDIFSKEITRWIINMNNILQKKSPSNTGWKKQRNWVITFPSFYIKKIQSQLFLNSYWSNTCTQFGYERLGWVLHVRQKEQLVLLSCKLNFAFCQNASQPDFICLFWALLRKKYTHLLLNFPQDFYDIYLLTCSPLSSSLSVCCT